MALGPPALETLVAGAAALGVRLGEEAMARFSTFAQLLQAWGAKMNLSTRLTDREIVVYHFLDSLGGAPWIPNGPDRPLVDIGTGAGFPGLPLKIAFPHLPLLLVEGGKKRVAFCQEVVRATGLVGVETVWGRAEAVGRRPEYRDRFSCAVSRALAPAGDVLALSLPFLCPGGTAVLYKGRIDEHESRELDAVCGRRHLSWIRHPVSIPGLDGERSIVVVGNVRETG